MYTKLEDDGVIIAQPGALLTKPARPGDRLTRWSHSEGVEYSGIVVSEAPETAEALTARGIPVEPAGEGQYVEVLEIAPGSTHTRTIGRRLTDRSRRVPRGQAVSRPSWNEPATEPPAREPAAPPTGAAPGAEPYGFMPPPGPYGTMPPPGAYGAYGGMPPPGPYGGIPPTGPYGGMPPPGPYGQMPPPGPYGAAPQPGWHGGAPPMEPYGGIAGYEYGYLPPAGPPANMPPPPAAAPYGSVPGYDYGYLPPAPPPAPGGASESIDFSREEAPEYAEQIDIDDVAVEMNGLRCEFLEAVTTGRPEGLSRSFRAGEIATITNWNGTAPAAEVDSFLVSKLAIAPKYDRVPGIREYVLPLAAQRRAVRENMRELADWRSRESTYARNRGAWEREKTRLEDLLQRRQQIYSRMWVRQMMYNRFDPIIARWTEHYNRMFRPRPNLDPNIVKSMLYQESRFGTSGRHLMPPPSDWSLATHQPIRSRFNIGQAIDSFGPQQWLMMREMAPSITAQHGLDALAARDRWIGMSNSDYTAHLTFMTALREFFEHRDGAGRNLMGTPDRDLHEDYAFWIRTAIRWLFEKFRRLSTQAWNEAVRAYNGSGEHARRYRDAVMARAGSTDPFTAEEIDEEEVDMNTRYTGATEVNGRCSLCGHGMTAEDAGLAESGPSRETSARLEWENQTRIPDSKGDPQVFYVVTGAPRGKAAAGYEQKAVLPMRVYNTNTVYNHKDVRTKWRLLKPKQGYREVRTWSTPEKGPDLEDESWRPLTFSLVPPTLADAYDSDDPLTRFEMEYHWRETFESRAVHYNSTGLDFFLVAPIEYLLSRKTRLNPPDKPEIVLDDPQYQADYWIPVGAGVKFSQHLRTPVTIQVEVSYSLADEFRVDRSATATRSRTQNVTQTTSNTFNAELSGSASQGAKVGGTVKGLQLGLERMFQLGAKLGYSRTKTDTTSVTVAREFSQSLGMSKGYTASQTFKIVQTQTLSPVPPAPTGTGSRSTPAPGSPSVALFLCPVVSFFDVPYVKFDNVNQYGQATKRTTGSVAVPFITRWVFTTGQP